jgi:hypothetical protein
MLKTRLYNSVTICILCALSKCLGTRPRQYVNLYFTIVYNLTNCKVARALSSFLNNTFSLHFTNCQAIIPPEVSL